MLPKTSQLPTASSPRNPHPELHFSPSLDLLMSSKHLPLVLSPHTYTLQRALCTLSVPFVFAAMAGESSEAGHKRDAHTERERVCVGGEFSRRERGARRIVLEG